MENQSFQSEANFFTESKIPYQASTAFISLIKSKNFSHSYYYRRRALAENIFWVSKDTVSKES